MRKALVIVSIILVFSCGDAEINSKEVELNSKKEVKKESADTTKLKWQDYLFAFRLDDEKISLLSIAKNISKDTLSFIIKDYHDQTTSTKDSIIGNVDYQKVISELSKKYRISRRRIAAMIYSYEYEMLTKEDAEDDFYVIEND